MHRVTLPVLLLSIALLGPVNSANAAGECWFGWLYPSSFTFDSYSTLDAALANVSQYLIATYPQCVANVEFSSACAPRCGPWPGYADLRAIMLDAAGKLCIEQLVRAYDAAAGWSPPPGVATCVQRTIKLSRSDGSSESSMVIDSIEPSKTTPTMRATVYDDNNQPVPNIDIRLEVSVAANSGGHQHHDDARPKGLLSTGIAADVVVEGNTGTDGMPFTFKVPDLAGDHTIKASCVSQACQQEGANTVWVGVKDLVPLGTSQYFVPVGDTLNHFDNHYLTLVASSRINVLAALYRAKFPNYPLLHLNDASLERGGLLDANSDWKPPHHEHCRGTEIDVRANDAPGAIPSISKVRQAFEELAGKVGADPMWEIPKDKNKNPRNDLRHYHVRLMGGIPQCP